MSMNDYFDATNIPPVQGGGTHPVGKFPAQISNTFAKSTKDQTGGMLSVEFTTPAGRIVNNYNLWNANAQAVDIAQKELSALCHAVSRYRISFPKLPDGQPNLPMAAAELRGANLQIEVGPQLNRDGTPNGYVEVKKVYDSNGNEPGKPAQQQPALNQPQAGQAGNGAGWGNPAPATTAAPGAAPAGWGNPNPPGQAWQPGPTIAQNPPNPPQNPPNAGAPPWAR